MTPTSRRVLAMPAIVAIAGFRETGPGAEAPATHAVPGLPGARSVVIHAAQTNHDTGTAGARLACLPVVW